MGLRRGGWFGVAAGAVAGALVVPALAAAAAGATFEIYQDARKEFRWRLRRPTAR